MVFADGSAAHRTLRQLVTRLDAISVAVFAAALATLAPTSGSAALAAPTDCSAANKQLEGASDTASINVAYAMYANLLEIEHESPCAKAGLTAAGNLRAAQQLRAAGLYSEVPKLVIDAVKAYPKAPIPPELLNGLVGTDVVTRLYDAGLVTAADEALKAMIQSNPNGPLPTEQARANRGFAVAAALEKKGYHDGAVQAFQQTLTAYPRATPPDDVSSLLGPQRPIWMPDWVYTRRIWILGVLVPLLVLLLVALLGRRAWIQSGRWLGGGRLMVASFDGGDSAAHYGDGFAATVRDYIRRLTTTHGFDRLDMVSKWGDPATLPTALSSIAPQATLISGLVGLIAKLLPNKDKSLAGFLHVSQTTLAGLSLSLENPDGRVINRRSIWKTDFAPLPGSPSSSAHSNSTLGDVPLTLFRRLVRALGGQRSAHEPPKPPAPPTPSLSTLYPLAYPAAVWALWQFAEKRATKLGTRSWESFANFGLGVNFQEQGEFDRAKDFYRRALAQDHRNEAAKFNLAVLQLWHSDDLSQ